MSEKPSADVPAITQKNEQGEQQPEIPESLRPLMGELNLDNLELLNGLNQHYNDLLQNEWKVVYNGEYQHARSTGRSDGIARTIAYAYASSPKGQMHISRNVQALMTRRLRDAVKHFMGGVAEDSPDFKQRYDEVYGSVLSAASTPQEEWIGYQYTDKNGTSGYTGGLYDRLREQFSDEPRDQASTDLEQELAEPGAGIDNVDAPTAEQALAEHEAEQSHEESELDKIAREYLEATINRQKAPFYKRRKAEREYQAAREEYGHALADFQDQEIQRMRDEGKTNAEILEWLEDHVNQVAGEDIKDRTNILQETNGWIAKQLEKYANASTKKKILIGLGVGAAMGAAGFGVGVLAGAVGAGAAVAGTFVGAGRFVRTYAMGMSRMYKNNDSSPRNGAFSVTFAELDAGEITDETLDRAIDYVVGQGDAIIEKSDKVRRRAVAFAVGSVAIGSGVGIAAGYAADWVDDGKIGMSFGKTGDMLVGNDHPGAPVDTAPQPPVNPDQPFINMHDQLVPPDADAQQLFAPDAFKGGVDMPIKPGDGFERLADRYGLNDEQLQRLKEIMAGKSGETYTSGSDLRLNLGDGNVHLSAEDVQKIFGVDKMDVISAPPVSASVGEQLRDQLVPDNSNAQKLFTPKAFEGGVRVPVEPGDGFESLGDRYGLSASQLDELKNVVGEKVGETYVQGGDLRLSLGDRGFNLTADELKQILKAK